MEINITVQVEFAVSKIKLQYYMKLVPAVALSMVAVQDREQHRSLSRVDLLVGPRRRSQRPLVCYRPSSV
jgi:hypothetical protein